MRHCCPRQPKTITVEHDIAFGWAVISQQGIIEIQWCPWCGKELKEPTVTHIVLKLNLCDGQGNVVIPKGNICEITRTCGDNYFVTSDEGRVCTVSKGMRGYVFDVKEVL